MYSEKKGKEVLTNYKKNAILEYKEEEDRKNDDVFSESLENSLSGEKKRSRWFTVILYPDNAYHMDFLTYINNAKSLQGIKPDFQAFYIFHKAEKTEKKDHYHLQIYFDNERTVNGVCKMFGVGNYYRDSNNSFRAVYDTTGFPEEIKIEQRQNVTPSICSAVSDIHSYYMYLKHRTYACYLEGKRQYSDSDFRFISRDWDFYKLVSAPSEKVGSVGSEISQILEYCSRFHITSMKYLLQTLISNDEYKLIKYVEKNTYLVNNLIHYKI